MNILKDTGGEYVPYGTNSKTGESIKDRFGGTDWWYQHYTLLDEAITLDPFISDMLWRSPSVGRVKIKDGKIEIFQDHREKVDDVLDDGWVIYNVFDLGNSAYCESRIIVDHTDRAINGDPSPAYRIIGYSWQED